MSFHHQMMLQRYGLGGLDMHSQIVADPIFTPLITAAFQLSTAGAAFAATTIGANVIGGLSALAAGGDFGSFAYDRD